MKTSVTAGRPDRLHSPMSTEELERRWGAVRSAMANDDLSVLVMQNYNDYMGGYVKYFTDLPAENGYPYSVVFPRDEPMLLVRHGEMGGDRTVGEGDETLRGVQRVLSTASMVTASYSRYYDAELIANALRPFATSRIGLVGTASMSMATGEYLRRELPEATWVEASELVDRVRTVKSAEEIRCIEATAVLQDQAMAAAFEAVAPGKKESDIAAVAQHVASDLGSEQGIYRCASARPGEPALIAHRHYQNRVLRPGDIFYLLIETNGPGGLYTELGRTCVLGSTPRRFAEEYEFTLAAQRFCYELLRPGASPAQIWDRYNGYLRDNGKPAETRIHCHGQGVDLVERPLIRFDETFSITADMNLACHPRHVAGGFASWVCDNILVEPAGVRELHGFSKAVAEL